MSFVAAAVVGGAVVGGVITAEGAKSAANTQANAENQASSDQVQMFNTITGNEQPFMNAGVTATNQLNSLTAPGGYLNNQTSTPFSFNPSSITSSPGYQFSQTQGLQQTQNAIAPNVGALSGPALQALTNYSTGNAEQYYNNYFNQAQSQYQTNFNAQQTQQQNIFSRLSTIAGIGQNAASNTGTAGAALGTGAAQATAGAGAASAAGTVGAANALGGAASSAGNGFALSSILNNNSASASSAPSNNLGTDQLGSPSDLTSGFSGS
jgi:hypothetical protein